MYYEPIFEEFSRRFPKTTVYVACDFPVSRYPRISLNPRLRYLGGGTMRALPGAAYSGGRPAIPTVSTAVALLRDASDVRFVVEFSPVSLVGWITGRLSGARIVLLIESDTRFRGGKDSRFARVIKGWFARHSDVVMTNGAPGREYALGRLGVDPGRLLTAPYLTSNPVAGIDSPRSVLGPRVRDRRRFLFANSLTTRKGLDRVLTALAAMSRENLAKLELVVVGDGDQRTELEGFARAHDLPVTFVGRVSYGDLGNYIAEADVLLVPSLSDYRSLAVFEAILAGKPVLGSTRDGSTHEVLVDGVNGYAVDPEDLEQMTIALGELAKMSDARLDLMAHSSMESSVLYTVDSVLENLSKAVQAALSAGDDHL